MRDRQPSPISVKWIRGGLIILGAGMILLAAAFLTVDFVRSRTQSKNPNDVVPQQGNIAEQMKAQQNAVVLLNGALVTYEYHYTLCGHTKTEVKAATPAMIGLNQEELGKTYPQMQIGDFSPNSFKATISVNLYCPDHFILKADGGMVDIYQTNQDTGAIEVTKKLSIPLTEFDADRTDDLKTGIPFDTIESLEEFLDDQEV